MIAITTSSSIRVNAARRLLIDPISSWNQVKRKWDETSNGMCDGDHPARTPTACRPAGAVESDRERGAQPEPPRGPRQEVTMMRRCRMSVAVSWRASLASRGALISPRPVGRENRIGSAPWRDCAMIGSSGGCEGAGRVKHVVPTAERAEDAGFRGEEGGIGRDLTRYRRAPGPGAEPVVERPGRDRRCRGLPGAPGSRAGRGPGGTESGSDGPARSWSNGSISEGSRPGSFLEVTRCEQPALAAGGASRTSARSVARAPAGEKTRCQGQRDLVIRRVVPNRLAPSALERARC